MGRLIDADIVKYFKNKIKDYDKDYAFSQEEVLNILERYERKYAKSTIEAIPKAEMRKMLRDCADKVSDNVLDIVRKEYIPKDRYEARLKADMYDKDTVAWMFRELQLEIEELDSRAGYDGNGMPTFSTDYIRKKKVNELIQQKIDLLKENKE